MSRVGNRRYCQVRVIQDLPGYINLGGPICGARASIRHHGYFIRLEKGEDGIEYIQASEPLGYCPNCSAEFLDAQARIFRGENPKNIRNSFLE